MLFKLISVLIACMVMLGGCASGLEGLANRVASEAEKADVSGAVEKAESALGEVAGQISGAAGKYHTKLTGRMTSFTVDSPDQLEAYTLDIKDIYFTGMDDVELVIKDGVSGGGASVTVECPEDMLDYGIAVDIEDGRITVSCAEARAFTCDEFRVTVTGLCDKIYIATGMDVDIDAARAGDFMLDVKGAVDGDVFGLDAGLVTLKVDGAASLELSGSARRLECVFNGAGDLDADELAVSEAKVEVNGAGNISLNVADKLEAALRGAGNVTYIGSPELIKEVSGLGRIEKAAKAD